jgi:hypothetical protein
MWSATTQGASLSRPDYGQPHRSCDDPRVPVQLPAHPRMKCEDLHRSSRYPIRTPSTLSLLGLVRHARVEHNPFQRSLQGHRDVPRLSGRRGRRPDRAVADLAGLGMRRRLKGRSRRRARLDGPTDLGAVVPRPRKRRPASATSSSARSMPGIRRGLCECIDGRQAVADARVALRHRHPE